MSTGDKVITHGPIYDAVREVIGYASSQPGDLTIWVDGTARGTCPGHPTCSFKWHFTKDWVLKVEPIENEEFDIIRDWAQMIQSSDPVQEAWDSLDLGERKGLRDAFVVVRDAATLGGLAGEVMDMMMKFRTRVLYARDQEKRLAAKGLVQV